MEPTLVSTKNRLAKVDQEAVDNLRYSQIRNRANQILDETMGTPAFESKDVQNELFELGAEYVDVCARLAKAGYTGAEPFPE